MSSRTLRKASVVLGLLVLATTLVFAQAGRGKGRLGGVVINPDGQPVVGAQTKLVFSGNKNLIFEQTTGKKGVFSFIGLGTGKWILTVTADGFAPFETMVEVSQLQVNPKVVVAMKMPQKSAAALADEKSIEILEQGNQFFKDGRFDEAITAYKSFLEANPGLYQIQVSIADCLREKGEFDEAIALYNQVIERATDDTTLGREIKAKALAGIGNCYLKQNKLAEAQEFLRQSVESSPDDEILAYNVGEIYFSNQSLDEALRYFGLASGIKPSWSDPFLKLGYVYLNKADNAKAIENFEKFLALEPEGERAALVKNILGVIKK